MASLGEEGDWLEGSMVTGMACRRQNAVAMAIINFGNSLTLFPQHNMSENATSNYL